MSYKEVLGPNGKPIEYKYRDMPIDWIKPLWQCRVCAKIGHDPAKTLKHAKKCKGKK